jgi:carbonic anhydrase/acetyltransferase-like protein (isoleucine patch superfamily)
VPLHSYEGKAPRVAESAFVAPGAMLIGDVEVGPEASIWFNAVLRGDSDRISVGARTNIQDLAMLHTDPGKPCEIGNDCTIGHSAIVHACRIGSGSLVGMGAIVLSGADIGEESLIAAGSLIPEGRTYPPRSLLVGSPVRRLRDLTDEDVERLIKPGVANYLTYKRSHAPG